MNQKAQGPEPFYPSSREAWRQWLQEHHAREQSVWIIYYKKKAGMPTITWSEAVDEALCFGWIDSKAMPVDEDKYRQFFSRRKAGSTWSKINKDKVAQLMQEGKMAPAGYDSIAVAQKNGSWNILDDVEALIIPPDLETAFKDVPRSKDFFLSLSKSMRKNILQWIVLAKREETRQKRVKEIAELTGRQERPRQF